MEALKTLVEEMEIMNFLQMLQDDTQNELKHSVKQNTQEAHRGNYNSIFGSILFSYCLNHGRLADALKIHKKINDFDLYLLENDMPDDEYEWCRINGEDFKAGEYHRQVCEMMKEQYDRRDRLIKKSVELMKLDCYKEVYKVFKRECNIFPEAGFDEIYKTFMECPYDRTLNFTRNPFEKKN